MNFNEVKNLTSYIAEKYAGLLTEDDVANLFDLLTRELGGNRSEAARQSGLTGKATYDWAQVAYVKLGTKKKVLDASLKTNFAETVEYLLDQCTDRNIDLLRTVLETFYANALESTSQDSFKEVQLKFDNVRKNHAGLIRDGIQNEVVEMEISLKSKAEQFGLVVEPKATNELSADEVLNAIELLGNVYVENPAQVEALAVKDMGLPLETVKPIIATFRNLCSTSKMQTDMMADTHMKMQTVVSAEPSASNIYANVFKSFTQQTEILRNQLTSKLNEGGINREITTTA